MEGYVPGEPIRTANGANSDCFAKRKSMLNNKKKNNLKKKEKACRNDIDKFENLQISDTWSQRTWAPILFWHLLAS